MVMHEQDKAILQSLVSVAWADGTFAEREKQMLDALLESFDASEAEAVALRAFAAEKKELNDIPLTELSHADRRTLMQHAVTLSWIDGEQHPAELEFLEQLRAQLNIPADENQALVEAATERAQSMLNLLANDASA